MRYIEHEEPTYNNLQVIAGSIVGVAAIVVAVGAIISLISSL